MFSAERVKTVRWVEFKNILLFEIFKNGEHLSLLQILKENTGNLHAGNLQLDMTIVQKCSETTFLYNKFGTISPESQKTEGRQPL